MKKPIVLLKGGKSKSGGKAAKSHCGALAGTRDIIRAAFRQAGIIEVSQTTEMLDLAKAFSFLPLPRGKRVGILTWGGGWGVITADQCEAAGLKVPDLGHELVDELSRYLPDYWPKANPIDLINPKDLLIE